MNKKGVFVMLIIVGVLLVVGFFWFMGNLDEEDGAVCFVDEDCVPISGCHPAGCVMKENLSESVDTMICTAVCSGPLDCGAGSCGCVNNRCEVILADGE